MSLPAIYDERLADQQVISNLIKEIGNLRSKLMPIVKTTDGKYYRVSADQEVSAEDLQAELSEFEQRTAELQALVAPTNDQPDPDPAQPEAPAAPEQPGTVEQQLAAAGPSASENQPTEPTTPPEQSDALPLN